jgi:hypothetical protein
MALVRQILARVAGSTISGKRKQRLAELDAGPTNEATVRRDRAYHPVGPA